MISVKGLTVVLAGAIAGVTSGLTIDVSPEGEVKTPEAALARVRELRGARKIGSDEKVTVRFAPGTYQLEKTLSFAKGDDGILFEGAEKGETIFSGGCRLAPFAVGADGIWRTSVPPGLQPEQLWVGGRRAVRARSPNKFYHYIRFGIDEGIDPATGRMVSLDRRAFVGYPKDMKLLEGLSPDELANVVFRLYWSWDTEYGFVRHVDVEKGEMYLQDQVKRAWSYWGGHEMRYTLENFRAALDMPGEWFHDRKRNEILYLPREGERPDRAHAVIPVLERQMTLCEVKDVTFRGIVFSTAAWHQPRCEFIARQAADSVPFANIEIDRARAVTFDQCEFRHGSAYAIWFRRDVHGCAVTRSYFSDLGAGGVRIGYGWQDVKGLRKDEVASDVTIDNNIFYDLGNVHPEGVGVFIAKAHSCRVSHNEICNLHYSGVSQGWTWGYGDNPVHDNIIEWNHIHHYGQGVLSDMGGIYTLGRCPGTRVCCNHVHDVFSYDYTGSGGTGLYPDEGSSHILWASNLVHDTKTDAVNLHFGRDNRFVNNIVGFTHKPGSRAIGRYRVQPHNSMTVSNNVIVWTAGTHAFGLALRRHAGAPLDLTFGSNLWWGIDGVKSNDFAKGSWEAWRDEGLDDGSILADPLFRDWRRGDWRLRPDSPAFKIGYREWDYRKCGVYGDAAWIKKARNLKMPKRNPAPEPPRMLPRPTCKLTFDALRPGQPVTSYGPLVAHSGGVSSSDGGVGGGTCLKIVDGPKTPSFDPYLDIGRLPVAKRRVRVAFAFKYGPEADFQHEWRDVKPVGYGWYVTGLLLQVKQGEMSLKGSVPNEKDGFSDVIRKLTLAKPNIWLRCSLDMDVTGPRPRVTFVLTTEDNRSEKVELLTLDGFESLDWMGFIAAGAKDNVYLLDEFSYEVDQGEGGSGK